MTDLEWLQFKTRFPELTENARAAALVRSEALVRYVPGKEVIYRDGDECGYLPMVIAGELILNKHAETGRSIVLYRVGMGESCILSTLSILTNNAFPAEAATDSPATVALIPAGAVRTLIDTDRAWRDFAFSIYHERVAGLITLLEEIVFARLDKRLAEYLGRHASGPNREIERTHQEIAGELGSSREVVSRLLKEWERRGVVHLGRGRVTVEDMTFFADLAAER